MYRINKILKEDDEIFLIDYFDSDYDKRMSVYSNDNFQEGDLVDFDENGDLVLVDISPLVSGNKTIRTLTNNGKIKPKDLPEEALASYRKTVQDMKEYVENPRTLSREETLEFLKTRNERL